MACRISASVKGLLTLGTPVSSRNRRSVSFSTSPVRAITYLTNPGGGHGLGLVKYIVTPVRNTKRRPSPGYRCSASR